MEYLVYCIVIFFSGIGIGVQVAWLSDQATILWKYYRTGVMPGNVYEYKIACLQKELHYQDQSHQKEINSLAAQLEEKKEELDSIYNTVLGADRDVKS